MRGEWNAPATSSGRRADVVLAGGLLGLLERAALAGQDDLAGRVVVGDGDAGGLGDRLARPRSCRPAARASSRSRRPRPSAGRAGRRARGRRRASSTPAAASAAELAERVAGGQRAARRRSACQPAIEAQKIAGWAKRVDSSTRANGSSPTSSMQRSSRSGQLPRDVVAHVGGLGALAGKQQGDVGSRGHGLHPECVCPRLPALAHSHPPGRGGMRHAVGGDRLRGHAGPAIRDRDALCHAAARGRLAARRSWRRTTTGCTS